MSKRVKFSSRLLAATIGILGAVTILIGLNFPEDVPSGFSAGFVIFGTVEVVIGILGTLGYFIE